MVSSFQHIGKRDHQEDAFHINEARGIFMVCDGIGGYQNGEIASQLVASSVADYFQKNKDSQPCLNCIKNAIQLAQQQLNLSENATSSKSGTTIALLVYHDGNAITAHMGDSRILFLKQNSTKIWTTKDHSVVQELFDAEVLKTEAEMLSHPMKNKITNAILSGRDADEIQITTHELKNIEKGDKFLLFTDGVLEVLSPNELTLIAQKNDATEAVSIISNLVKGNVSDNSTMIIVEI